MLTFRDFNHLPQVDALVEQMTSSKAGLLLVAGLDPRPETGSPSSGSFLASGRSAIFQILVEAVLEKHSAGRCLVVAADKASLRVARHLRQRVEFLNIQSSEGYPEAIARGLSRHPTILVIDRLTEESVQPALEAALHGMCVVAQLDTVFCGPEVLRHLSDLGASTSQLDGLAWILSVQRLPSLCPKCRQPVHANADQRQRMEPFLALLDQLAAPPANKKRPTSRIIFPGEDVIYYQSAGCDFCHHTGRSGDMAIFDVFQHHAGLADPFSQTSRLPIEAYILYLAAQGQLSLDDFLNFHTVQFHRTFNLLTNRERSLEKTSSTLERKLAELEAAQRVLEQRTGAIISLQDLSQALTGSIELDELAALVCRRARDLCGADRAILYYLHTPDEVEVLAALGWDPQLVHHRLPARQVFSSSSEISPVSYNRLPPGVAPPPPSELNQEPRPHAGLYVPLLAQDQLVGLMIVHTHQKPFFTPGEVAMIQAFARQAALAIQRAGLVEQLLGKISQLEAAQLELAKKERMERELELARQVQQSMLPRTFPQVSGFQFAARNEPARRVGGDFYDVISLDDDYFGLAIADVSDKSMPAALYMALARSLLMAEARRARSPRIVLESVNQLLLALDLEKMFVTVFYGIVQKSTRRLVYARAGHDRPLLVRAGRVQELDGLGIALGVLEGELFNLSEEAVELQPRDRLVLYTDGLVDVIAPSGELYDRPRLINLIKKHASLPAARMCEAVLADLAAYRGEAEPFDDMTILVMEVEDISAPNTPEGNQT